MSGNKNNAVYKRMNKKYVHGFLLYFLLFTVSITFGQKEDLTILNKWIEWSGSHNMLINHLNKQAFDYYDQRDREIANLRTKTDWLKRQRKVREIFMDIAGPFPEKTPLNPKVISVIQKDGYRIEKIIYESMPGFYAVGCLFVPDDIKGKTPAILKLPGHNPISFRRETYQNVILNLVKKGFIVFAIDPIGQGEKVQYYDPERKSSYIGYSVIEHNYFGYQCFLSGVSSAKYFIWDAVRAVDYLLTRKDVDGERIGVTGLSGGGTISSYMCVFDERIKAIAPMNWATANRRLIESNGAQDAESNLYHSISRGITFEDLLELRAPKPTLMVFTTRDYLSIQGAREAYREIKRAYKAFGKEENLEMSEDDYKHGFTKKNNEAVYAFFQRHLNLPGSPIEEEVEVLTPEELNVTPTGQISTYLGGETVYSLNKKETMGLIEKIEDSRKNIDRHLDMVKIEAVNLSGYSAPEDKTDPVFCGRYNRDGYSVEMHVLPGEEGNYVIPLLLFVPEGNAKFPAVIYVHPKGKLTESSPDGEIEKLVKSGYIVAAPDLLGIGELEIGGMIRHAGAEDFLAIMIGRSTVGIQAGDIVRAVDFLKSRDDVKESGIGAVAFAETCPALLHAGAFEPSISSIALLGSIVSYKSIVMNEKYRVDYYSTVAGREDYTKWYKKELNKVKFSCGVAGVLTAYDLPDLLGCIAPRKVLLTDLKDQMLESASVELIEQDLAFPRTVYSHKKASENLKITSSYESLNSIVKWCFE